MTSWFAACCRLFSAAEAENTKEASPRRMAAMALALSMASVGGQGGGFVSQKFWVSKKEVQKVYKCH